MSESKKNEKKKSVWNPEFLKRLARDQEPDRAKKDERVRGFTPPMSFCECAAEHHGGCHQIWCPIVGGGGLTKPYDANPYSTMKWGAPSWHLGSGWGVMCTCGNEKLMPRAQHGVKCPVFRPAPQAAQ